MVGEGEGMKIDESALTGESMAVTRRAGDQVGTLLVYGSLQQGNLSS